MYLRPHFGDRFEKWGVRSANRPTMNRFENFSTFSYTKSELKGGPFYEKNCQLMYLGPYSEGHFGQMGVSANRPKFDRF